MGRTVSEEGKKLGLELQSCNEVGRFLVHGHHVLLATEEQSLRPQRHYPVLVQIVMSKDTYWPDELVGRFRKLEHICTVGSSSNRDPVDSTYDIVRVV